MSRVIGNVTQGLRTTLTSLLPLLLALTSFVANVHAQDASISGPADEIYRKPFGSYQDGIGGSVNLVNGKLVLDIPIFSYPQRGSDLKFGFHLSYVPQAFGGCQSGCPPPAGGFWVMPDYDDYRSNWASLSDPSPERVLGNDGAHVVAPLTTGAWITTDGTGLQGSYGCAQDPYIPQTSESDGTSYSITDKRGTTISRACNGITDLMDIRDKNGNLITTYPGTQSSLVAGWVDTLGRNVTNPFFIDRAPFSGGVGPLVSPLSDWVVPGINGANATFHFDYTSLTPPYQTNLPNNGDYIGGPGNGFGYYSSDPAHFTKLTLPDGTAWQFEYDFPNGDDHPHYGDLTKITLPTGGSATYQWSTHDASYPTQNCFPDTLDSRYVTSRTVDPGDGGQVMTWTYTIMDINVPGSPIQILTLPSSQPTIPGCPYAMVVVDPGGNSTVHVFQGIDSSYNYYEVETDVWDSDLTRGDGQTLISHTTKQYAHSPSLGTDGGGTNFYSAYWPVTEIGDTIKKELTYTTGPTVQALGFGPGSAAVNESVFLNEVSQEKHTDLLTNTGSITSTSHYWENHPGYFAAGLIGLPASISVTSADGSHRTLLAESFAYDEANSTASNISTQHSNSTVRLRGMLTTKSDWRDTDNQWISKSFTWYDTGVPYQSIDSNGHVIQTVSYDPAYKGAFPTQVLDAYSHGTAYTYDLNTGNIRTAADSNLSAAGTQVTYNYYTTGFYTAGRLQSITYPNSGQQVYSYPNLTTEEVSTSFSGGTIGKRFVYDGLGRIRDEQVLNVPAASGCSTGTLHLQTSYDSYGRIGSTTRPFCTSGDATYDIQYTSYDPLGRIGYQYWQNAPQNGAHIDYTGFSMQTETTGGGNVFYRFYDGRGNLRRVWAPSDHDQDGTGANSHVETDYVFDELNRLRKIFQNPDANHSNDPHLQSREFWYNSLSQLTHSYNPESGDLRYMYDSNGNVQTETDARGVVKLFCYDVAGRVVSSSITDSACSGASASPNPDVVYTYDSSNITLGITQANAIGRLSSIQSFSGGSPVASEAFAYDLNGNLAEVNEHLPSESGSVYHSTSASYDSLGLLRLLIYPSGRRVKYSYDPTTALASVRDVSGDTALPYFSSTVRYPDGSPLQELIGPVSVAVPQRDSQSREISRTASSPFAGPLVDMGFTYDDAHGGAPQFAVDFLHRGYSTSYMYDILNRVSSYNAVNALGTFSQTFAYNSYGNLTSQSGTGITAIPTDTDSRNRINFASMGCSAGSSPVLGGADPQSPNYDLAGNLLCTGLSPYSDQQYSYDAYGRLSAAYKHQSLAAIYSYSGEGRRVRSDVGGIFKEYIWFLGNVIEEKLSDGTLTDYIYADGQKIAQVKTSDPHLHVEVSSPGTGYSAWYETGMLTGYVIEHGDKLFFRQYQKGGATGGLALYAGNQTVLSLQDQNGDNLGSSQTRNVWESRAVALDAFAGQALSHVLVGTDTQTTAAGSVDIADLAVLSADGTVHSGFNGQPVSLSSCGWCGGGVSGGSASYINVADPEESATSTYYYLGDQLSTTQMELSADGWPVWQAQFSPFGQELDDGPTSMRYRFTGKERDAESGLDYFGARHYAGTLGRWNSPDPWIGSMDLSDPQSLNRYAYVGNSPTRFFDPDGLDRDCAEEGCGDGQQIGFIDLSHSQQYKGSRDSESSGCNDCGHQDPPDPNAPDRNGEDVIHGQDSPANWGENGFMTAVDEFVYSRGMQHVVDFSAGAADFITFGGTKALNNITGGSQFINYGSGTYVYGKGAGIGLAVADVAAGTLTALAYREGATAIRMADSSMAAGRRAGRVPVGGLFGRGAGKAAGVFNRGAIRFGWSWEGAADAGKYVIRLGIGDGKQWWSHWNFWIY